MRSPRTAAACAMEKRSSTVMIFPFVRMVSAVVPCAGTSDDAEATRAHTTAMAARRRFIAPSSGQSERQQRIRCTGAAHRRTAGYEDGLAIGGRLDAVAASGHGRERRPAAALDVVRLVGDERLVVVTLAAGDDDLTAIQH